jgi:D-alanyl-D-alanine carboxypeptidase
MNNIIEKTKSTFRGSKWLIISDGVMFLIVVAIAFGFFYQFKSINDLNKKILTLNNNISARLEIVESDLATTTRELSAKLIDQQNRAEDFEDTISDIAGAVGTLEKLSKTDKELLQKYSRVYFLSENYVPLRLSDIAAEYVLDPKKEMQFHSLALPYLKRLLDRARNRDLDIKVSSAYRSFGTQSGLKNNYLLTYGTGANQFSADQGYSEHQLGTAVDFVVSTNPTLTIAFETTPEFEWLTKNAHKYGFIMSYPKGNPFYQYEPWHWRFVGVDLATYLYEEEIHFSQLDQRKIDTYLVKIFD